MRRISLALAILALNAFAGADTLRSQVHAMNKAVHTATMHRDIDGFQAAVKASVTDDFKCSDKGRSISFDRMVAHMKRIYDAIPKMTSDQAITLSLVRTGDSAKGTTEHKIKGVWVDESGRSHKIAFYGTSVDTYRQVDGQWLMSSIDWRSRQMTKDGRPLKSMN